MYRKEVLGCLFFLNFQLQMQSHKHRHLCLRRKFSCFVLTARKNRSLVVNLYTPYCSATSKGWEAYAFFGSPRSIAGSETCSLHTKEYLRLS